MSETTARGETFALTGWRVVDGAVRFGFACDRYGAFEERVWLPGTPVPDGPDEGLSRLITLLHVALGVSAYKAAAARTLRLPAMSEGGQAMARRLYTEGLAEFFVRAGLAYPPRTEIAFEDTLAPLTGCEGPTSCKGKSDHQGKGVEPRRALVAFGGGKDSYVARAIAGEAGDEVTLASVVMSDAVADAIAATAPGPVAFLRRRLDSKLMVIEDGFNGHVPITAINMLVLALYARLHGHGSVVFANERSADEPTMDLDGVRANHQDSKSSAFEALMVRAVAEADPAAPTLFSALRPYSELWIASRFAVIEEAHPRFTSCNRNFRLAGDATRRWCGACAKCAFTSLVLSPFLDEAGRERAFGAELLDREALLPLYEQLVGLSDQKPWDCVGTIEECRAALWRLGAKPDTAGTLAVRTLLPDVSARQGEAGLAAAWKDAMRALPASETPELTLPERYRAAATRLDHASA